MFTAEILVPLGQLTGGPGIRVQCVVEPSLCSPRALLVTVRRGRKGVLFYVFQHWSRLHCIAMDPRSCRYPLVWRVAGACASTSLHSGIIR